MDFRKTWGGHSNPKNLVADFSTYWKKVQHCFPKRGGEGQRPLGVFPKIHPNFGIRPSLRVSRWPLVIAMLLMGFWGHCACRRTRKGWRPPSRRKQRSGHRSSSPSASSGSSVSPYPESLGRSTDLHTGSPGSRLFSLDFSETLKIENYANWGSTSQLNVVDISSTEESRRSSIKSYCLHNVESPHSCQPPLLAHFRNSW